MNQAGWITVLLLSTAIIGLHCCALYVCIASKELKKVRFLRLALFLSLSDFLLGVVYIYTSIFLLTTGKEDRTGEAPNWFHCMLIKNVTSGAFISSLLQTLLICLERLNATCVPKRRILTILTGNVSVGLCLAIPCCFAFIRLGIHALLRDAPCDSKHTIDAVYLLSHDIPVALLVSFIAVSYGVVIVRIVKQHKTVGIRNSNLTATDIKRNKYKAITMRRNIVTLGIIIVIAVTSVLPRSVIGLYLYSGGNYETIKSFLPIANTVFLMLSPLLDPVIYIFRVKKYREQLVCKCCLRSNTIANIEL